MKNCKYCGTEIDDAAVFCPSCGANQAADASGTSAPVTNAAANTGEKHTGFVVLGFFFPLIALILYLVWKDTEPAKAMACGKGGLMGLSFSYPLAALIIYIVMKDTYPDIAKACGICGIISLIVGVVVGIFSFVLMFLIGMSGAMGAGVYM